MSKRSISKERDERANSKREKSSSRRKQQRSRDSKAATHGDGNKVRVEDSTRDNDVAWYARNPEILRSAASLPFSQSLGTKLTIPASPVTNLFDQNPVPGLFVLRYMLTPGIAYESDQNLAATKYPWLQYGYNAPVNVSARNIYSFVRHANSGSTNYDAPNLMIYLLAMDSVYAFYSLMVKVYGMLRLYSFKNRYLPNTVVKACGCNFDDLMANMAQFRYYINTFAAKASAMCVPAIMDFFTRHFWLTQNLFCDGETSKAQMYQFCPLFFWKGQNLATAPMELIPTDNFNAESNFGLADLVRIGNDLLNPLLMNEDFNIMSGDILKAYGRENLYSLAPIAEDYAITPVYSEEVLTQIHNARSVHIKKVQYAATAAQGNNQLVGPLVKIREFVDSTIRASYVATTYANDLFDSNAFAAPWMYYHGLMPFVSEQLLNAHKDDVTPEDVMIMTRLMPVAKAGKDKGAGTSLRIMFDAVGSEIVCMFELYINEFVNGEPQLNVIELETNINPQRYNDDTIHKIFKYVSMFDQAPILQEFNQATAFPASPSAAPTAFTPATCKGWFGDMENFTTVSPEALSRMHETALLSMFAVPYNGSF